MKYPDNEFADLLEELLYVNNFSLNKKEVKHERKIIRKMINDIRNDKEEKYLSEEGDE